MVRLTGNGRERSFDKKVAHAERTQIPPIGENLRNLWSCRIQGFEFAEESGETETRKSPVVVAFKLGALEQYLEHEVEFRYGKEEKGAISELVNEQVISVINRGYRIEDYCLIVGGKEFSEILKNPSLFWAVCNCPYWAISWLSTLKRVSFSLSRDTG